jgi:hypothetical protein
MFYEVREERVQDGGRTPSGNRVSVHEAAEVLGVTVATIRKHIQRGTSARTGRRPGVGAAGSVQ